MFDASDCVQKQAEIVFKDAMELGGMESRKLEASAAAALYIACRMENVSSTI